MLKNIHFFKEIVSAEFHPERKMTSMLGWPPGGITTSKIFDYKTKSKIHQKLEQVWIVLELTAYVAFLLLITLSFCLYPEEMLAAVFRTNLWVTVGFMVVMLSVLYRTLLFQAYIRWMIKNKSR